MVAAAAAAWRIARESLRHRFTLLHSRPPSSIPHLLKDGAVVLVAPDENLGDGPQRLDQQAPVSVRHRLVLVQHRVQVSGMKRETMLCIRPLWLSWDFESIKG